MTSSATPANQTGKRAEMALDSRDYLRDESQRFGGGGGGFGRGFSGHSITTWLIIINAIVFVWDGIFGAAARGSFLSLYPWGYFSVDKAVFSGQVWRFATYQFLHAGFFHILFNMIGIYFFGPLLEQHLGRQRFLAYYLICGVGGAVVATLLGTIPGLNIFPVQAELIGASGALFGILVGCAVLFPHQRVQLLFPPIPMTMRTMALVFLAIASLSVVAGSPNAGGEAAHLGGALVGFVLIRQLGLLGWADRVSPQAVSSHVQDKRYIRKQAQKQSHDAEVDRILAKVRAQGLQSLTRGEKKTLAAETQAKRGG